MGIFLLLFTNLIPLYVLMAVGYAGGRLLNIQSEMLATLAIYIIVPVVAFGFVAELEFEASYALLPVIAYGILTAISIAGLYIGRAVFKDNRANLLSMCGAMANTGYFGLPVVLLLFKEQWVGVYMFMLLGGIVFEATIGYYIAARGRFTIRDSLVKLARFPTLYAIAAALVVNALDIELPRLFFTYRDYFKGAYVIVGMMIIGSALGKARRLDMDWIFLLLSFAGQFVLWPLLAYGAVLIDRTLLHFWGEEVHGLLLVMSLMPPAANITAFAAQLDLRPEKVAATVLLGTVFALFYIPVMLVTMGLY
jgi:malate permease and related proteins